MRKLLVASQKGGVGKTTTSMNLAAATAGARGRVLLLDADPLSSVSVALNLTAHPERQTLRQLGIDLPGALIRDVVPGVDVISPYDEGRCTDDDFDAVVRLVTGPTFREAYSCLLVDAPPFLGANPGQLLRICDEFILVMRAEPMAYRTLPAFLELVQRNRGATKGIQMRGILLTLNEGENRGDRWERELRGRFGSRILSRVIPYDGEVAQATLFGRILSHTNPEAEVAREYAGLVADLGLYQGGATTTVVLGELLQTAARGLVFEHRATTASASGVRRNLSNGRTGGSGAALLDATDSGESPVHSPAPEPLPEPTPEPIPPREILPSPPVRRQPPRSRPGAERPVRPAPIAVLPPADTEPEPVVVPSRPKAKPTPRKPSSNAGQWLVPIFLAGMIGFGLGAVRQPAVMMPVLVGTLVALIVVLLLRRSGGATAANTNLTKTPRRPGSNSRLSKPVRRVNPVRRKPMDR